MNRPTANERVLAERRGRSAAASMYGVDHEVISARSNAAAQFRSQLFGDMVGIQAVADDLRTYENDQLGPGSLLVLMREGITKSRDFIKQGDAVAVSVLLLADQAGEQHGLPAGDRDRALDPPLGDGRRQGGRRL